MENIKCKCFEVKEVENFKYKEIKLWQMEVLRKEVQKE
jgi:hypothetical protein